MKQTFTYVDFFKHINNDVIVLTPNRRLSATLNKYFIDYQLSLNKTHWHTPTMLPLNSWIIRTWHEYISQRFERAPLLLNTLQEQYLWENILADAKESLNLLQISQTADIARSAFHLLKQWQINCEHTAFDSAEDYRALKSWIQRFEAICVENNWIDQTTLITQLIEWMTSLKIITAKTFLFVGFTELSPQILAFITGLQNAGNQVQQISLMNSSESAIRICLADIETEILTMARFAKSVYENNRTARIACVIPTLDKHRDRVLQIFTEIFSDYKNALTHSLDIINISAGKPLANYPVIDCALKLLGLNKKNISLDTFSHLLFSPFLGGAESERIKRALFDTELRQANIHTIQLTQLFNGELFKQVSLLNTCPILTKHIQQFLTQLENLPKTTGFNNWVEIFNHLLLSLGWPGERSVNSEEYQVIENWLKLLNDFTTLSHVSTSINYHDAVQILHKLATKIIFQPKTPDAPIQILGLLEAASLPFDYVWVAGLNDLSWPPQPKPNPLIPKSIQRELNMPHATSERELIFCETLTQQFKNSARHIVFSHAKKEDELEFEASPLIRDLPEVHETYFQFPKYQSIASHIFSLKDTEYLSDEIAPPLVAPEKVRGGVNTIKHQALCPFKAFAEYRLHARELEEPVQGLRAKDRGSIIHKALELIWNKLQDQMTLKNLSDDALHALIDACINQALAIIPHARNHFKIYMSLEKKRLRQLIFNWLQIEKDRPYFKIANTEKNIKLILNTIEFNVRVDRVDEFENGEQFIIDYKTGKTNDILNWFGERMEEPQLPLYCLTNPQKTIGIAFAQLVTGDYCIKGLSRNALDIRGIKTINEIKKTKALSWDEQIHLWNSTLLKLSHDFQQGVATVDPKDPPTTCTWCALTPFCRIHEEGM